MSLSDKGSGIVDNFVAHYDEIFRLKGVAAKTVVFCLITGMWATPAERCFLWMGIYSLQHSSQKAEEALSQGLDQLHQSLVDTIASGSVNDVVHHKAVALGKLTNLEGLEGMRDNGLNLRWALDIKGD
nr:hypothetical protein [Tanacetum cinerariifolium]